MSVLMVAWGSASNSAQFHSPTMASPSSRAKVQFSTLIWGVGPAERTGKSVVTYCPGGNRPFGVSCRLDLKPREIGDLLIAAPSFNQLNSEFSGTSIVSSVSLTRPNADAHPNVKA